MQLLSRTHISHERSRLLLKGRREWWSGSRTLNEETQRASRMAMTVAMLLLLLPRTLHITTCLTGVLVTVCVGARSFVVVPSECCCLRIAAGWNSSVTDV